MTGSTLAVTEVPQEDTAPTPTVVSEAAPETPVAAPEAAAPAAPQLPKIFADPVTKPTQKGPEGVLFDFNAGCRVAVPNVTDGPEWRIRFTDVDTGNTVFETTTTGGSFSSTKVYFVNFKLEVWRGERQVLDHTWSGKGKAIQIQIPVGTLGDAIAWFPYADHFQRKHDCKLTCVASEPVISMFAEEYPNIRFITLAEAEKTQEAFYATYRVGLFFNDWNCTHQPMDFRYVGLHKTAAHILGVDPIEEAPRVHLSTKERTIPEPYVCIAVQSSTQCKYWNHPQGWRELVAWLKDCGYRVLCIDKDPTHGQGLVWNHIPHGAEDFTGALPLPERAALLKHADFFVGLSSGVSWLAWASGTPVVMISGFTHPNNEFHTPYRVWNHHTCNSCWNDPRIMFDHFDFLWCPRHKGTDRQFECTRLITLDHVKSMIRRIPGTLIAKGEKMAAAKEETVPKAEMAKVASDKVGHRGQQSKAPKLNEATR